MAVVTDTAGAWRKIALLSGGRRVDLAMPLDETLDDAVRRLGVPFAADTHVILDGSGTRVALTRSAAELADGDLLAIVDLRAPAPRRDSRRRSAGRPGSDRPDTGAVWWLLAIAGGLLATLGFAGAGALIPDAGWRVVLAAIVGLAATASAVVWTRHRPSDSAASGISMLAPLMLAFAAGVIAVPPALESAGHLAAAAGLLAAAVVATMVAITVTGLRLRAAAISATAILLVLTLVWGVTLWIGWSPAAAAAISAAAAPLALRALPSMLVGVAEGFHIDYVHFMSSRWTVRGAIPEDPGPVKLPEVRNVVDDSSARLAVGTVLFSAAPVVCLPFVLPALGSADPFVFVGVIVMLSAIVIALLLAPRHSATPVLRWVPRASAAIVITEAAVAVALAAAPVLLTVATLILLVVGLVAAATVVPIGRGAASLGWSRLADIVETLAIAIAMPAALLAADSLNTLRGMMAG